tara:strand:+ start:1649 stop:3481 length:1833 start_codon:yes stop_codon:yes gene_type:complete
MSNVTLQDTNFEAEINFISLDSVTGNSKYLPIDLASVSYFEIRDDLINFGLTGNLTFPDWGQLLSKLNFNFGKVNDVDNKDALFNSDEQYITIKLRDTDMPTDKNGGEVNGYEFIASAKSSASLMSNVTDVKKTVDFEEDLTALLKKISWEVFADAKGKTLSTLTKSSALPAILTALLESATGDRFEIAQDFVERTLSKKSNTLKVTEFLNNQLLDQTSPNSISLYELIQNLYNSIVIGNGGARLNTDTSLPLLKTAYKMGDADSTNVGGRVIELKELLSITHLNFIDDYIDGKASENDYTEVYTEEFSIAGGGDMSATENSSLDNIVEDYNLIKPDINNLRQTIWGAYKYVSGQPGINALPERGFNFFVNGFEQGVLRGRKSNLPVIKPSQQKVFTSYEQEQNKAAPNVLDKDRDINKVLKSFIYLNETMVLNVKGKMYRKPGKFITIKGDMCNSPAEELWYVIAVKHKFVNGNYTNEITAVRFLADGETGRRDTDFEKTYPVERKIIFEGHEAKLPGQADSVITKGPRAKSTTTGISDPVQTGPTLGGEDASALRNSILNMGGGVTAPSEDDATTKALDSLKAEGIGDLSTAGDSMLPQLPQYPTPPN